MSYVKRNTQVIRSFTAQGRRRLANNRKKGCEVRLAGKTLAREPPPNHFWSAKLAVMGRQGVAVFSRSLRYRNKTVTLPDRSAFTFLVGEEKGVDIRIALDTIRMAHRGEYDVAVILSQDQDFSEVADEIRVIAQRSVDQDRLRFSAQPHQSEPPRHQQD